MHGGALRLPQGERVQLRGVQLTWPEPGTPTAPPLAAALQEARTLLSAVPHGQRCVAVDLHHVAQLQPTALAQLDHAIAELARAGAYTLLRLPARLWLHGHHLRLARRYTQRSTVLFALMGRSALGGRLVDALQELHHIHPRALVWLPLASAGPALQRGIDQGLGLLWDASAPQKPPAALMAAALRHPLVLDGWQPRALSATAQERLVTLCAHAGMGWLAQDSAPWLARTRGMAVLSRSAQCVQRAAHLSTAHTAAAWPPHSAFHTTFHAASAGAFHTKELP